MHGPGRAGSVGECDALGDDAAGACRVRGLHEVARALAAQTVVEHEVALDLARIDASRQRSELVDHRFWASLLDGPAYRSAVERVGNRGLGAQRPHPVGPLAGAHHASDVMSLS